MNMPHTLGLLSLRGIVSPFVSVVEKIVGIEFELFANATDAVASLHNVVYSIAPGQRYNSYATAFYSFFVDGGVIGIVIGSLLFGGISGSLYKKYIRSHSLLSCLRYGYFIAVFIFFSMLQISSMINYLVWPLILFPIVCRKKCRID